MATCKEQAPQDLHDMVYRIMEKYHKHLREAGVIVTVLFAWAVDKYGETLIHAPAIKVRGQAALAVIRKSNARDRALGSGDVIMEIDRSAWKNELSDTSKESLLSHELSHVDLKYEKKSGLPVATVEGRPAIVMEYHDFETGIFLDNIRRYGKDSVDFLSVRDMFGMVEKALAESVDSDEEEIDQAQGEQE